MGCAGIGRDRKESIYHTTMIQGMVIAAANETSTQVHQVVGFVFVQTRLDDPDEVGRVGGVEVGWCGCAGRWVYVEVCHIVAEATYERIPAIGPMNNADDAGSNLANEVVKPGGQTMDNEEVQEWFWDGLTKAAQFRGLTIDLGAVLDEGFGKHASLEKPSEHWESGCATWGCLDWQTRRDHLECKVQGIHTHVIPVLGMEDDADLAEPLGKALGLGQRR
jgi:hypothetical protein